MYRLITVVFVLVISAVSASAQSLQVPSYWKSQRGSDMKLYDLDAQGAFTGVMINHATGNGCQNTPYDVHGHANGPYVTFTVVWKNWVEDCHSTAVWRGRVNGKTIVARWVFTYPDKSGRLRKLRGVDTFQQQL